MKHLFLVKSSQELTSLRRYAEKITPLFERYLLFLKETCQVRDLPRAIVWTDYDSAVNIISGIPLPAYTNDYRTVMVPDIAVWGALYQRQLVGYPETAVTARLRDYYSHLSDQNILQILGHEMVHHSELFIDEAYETEMWFEEGMAEYISRKYFLSLEAYAAEKEANQALTALHEEKYGRPSLNAFTQTVYAQDLVHVFYAYWRSFLMIDLLVEQHGGSVSDVFASYHRWYASGTKEPLEAWFAHN